MPWAAGANVEKVEAVATTLAEHERIEKELARLVATLVVINTIIVTERQHSAAASITFKKYITGRLSVPLAELPAIVQKAYEEWATGSTGGGVAAVPNHTEGSNPTGNEGKQKLKKLRIGK